MSVYRERLRTAAEAVQDVQSGQTVYLGSGCAMPHVLVDALVARAPELQDVEIIHHLTIGDTPYLGPDMAGHFRCSDCFVAANTREAVNEGRADYIPIHLHEMPRLFRRGVIPLDCALVVVSPPDEHGFCSFGIEVGVTKPAALSAKRIVAEVNRRMPRTLGDSFLHVSKIDAFVEVDRDLDEFRPAPPTEVELAIGRNVAGLIGDGACLQLGLGAISNTVLGFLGDRRDLGVHTEMFTEALPKLLQTGVVTGERKTFHPGKVVAGFIMGTREVYDFAHDNALIEFHPTDYVNHPVNIARNDHMVAVNSAIQVDLTGQVCSDSIGLRIHSGFGGQADFMRGAALSKGGLPVIALPSTTDDGSISRIVPILDPGAGVVLTRADVHVVVTEYGVAPMLGRNVRQRAEALISIAHPKFREGLLAAARER
ncbi:MAG TPA: acetyl-CoA hydrolase/transferase C-terminal domain-containing protein, partial [Candidatus Krumholzibacteria bacterium]|nr:acetyl-CoA hydrolase/transferase C-terminal domain-containing protein [Candidatus Krumholzibacteria bacterium]